MFQRPLEPALVSVAQREKPSRILMHLVGTRRRSRTAREDVGRHRRHVGEREHERADHGRADRERHRTEHPALDPLQCEDRDVDGDDDRNAEYDRSADLERRTPDQVAAIAIITLQREPTDEVLHHHHARVDDEAEIERAQTHQVGRESEPLHRQEGDEE